MTEWIPQLGGGTSYHTGYRPCGSQKFHSGNLEISLTGSKLTQDCAFILLSRSPVFQAAWSIKVFPGGRSRLRGFMRMPSDNSIVSQIELRTNETDKFEA